MDSLLAGNQDERSRGLRSYVALNDHQTLYKGLLFFLLPQHTFTRWKTLSIRDFSPSVSLSLSPITPPRKRDITFLRPPSIFRHGKAVKAQDESLDRGGTIANRFPVQVSLRSETRNDQRRSKGGRSPLFRVWNSGTEEWWFPEDDNHGSKTLGLFVFLIFD